MSIVSVKRLIFCTTKLQGTAAKKSDALFQFIYSRYIFLQNLARTFSALHWPSSGISKIVKIDFNYMIKKIIEKHY